MSPVKELTDFLKNLAEMGEKCIPGEASSLDSLQELVIEMSGVNISEAEAKKVLDILSKILHYEPRMVFDVLDHYLSKDRILEITGDETPSLVLGELSLLSLLEEIKDDNCEKQFENSSLPDMISGRGGTAREKATDLATVQYLISAGSTLYPTDATIDLDLTNYQVSRFISIFIQAGSVPLGLEMGNLLREGRFARRDIIRGIIAVLVGGLFLKGANYYGNRVPETSSFKTLEEGRISFRNLNMVQASLNVLSRNKSNPSNLVLFSIASGHNIGKDSCLKLFFSLENDPKAIDLRIEQHAKKVIEIVANKSSYEPDEQEAIAELENMAVIMFSNPGGGIGKQSLYPNYEPESFFRSPALIFFECLVQECEQTGSTNLRDFLNKSLAVLLSLTLNFNTFPEVKYKLEKVNVNYNILYKNEFHDSYSLDHFFDIKGQGFLFMGLAKVCGLPVPILKLFLEEGFGRPIIYLGKGKYVEISESDL